MIKTSEILKAGTTAYERDSSGAVSCLCHGRRYENVGAMVEDHRARG